MISERAQGTLNLTLPPKVSCRPGSPPMYDESYEEECMEVFLGEESCGHRSIETRRPSSINCGNREILGHRSQETIHPTSSNHRGHGRRSSLTIQSSSCNRRGYVDRSVYMLQETSSYYSCNQ